MSLEDFIPIGESRVLWSRFESLVGQQVFRLRVEGEAANIPTSLCSLLSCNLSSPERISHLEPAQIQSGHLQKNTNALEIDKRPLCGLPYIAQSACPLLRLVLLTMQELRCLDRYMNPCDALQRLRNIKRSLLDVHKKALLLESQLHQYINPTLVTTLNRRTAKATFESELMCKLVDKLRKDSRQSASDPDKRKRSCELTMKLKSLLLRQKCEWQCVGRLKETIAMAHDMKGVLKFICQLSCLLEHCCDASRRLTERPPPYEYSSSYDSSSKQDSPDALYEDLKKRTDNHSRPHQSQSSHSELTISLSLDFTSDKEFCEKSYESGSCTDTRTSNSRQQQYSGVRVTKDNKCDSDVTTIRQSRTDKEEAPQSRTKPSKSKNKRSKSASSVSSQKSCRFSEKHYDEEGKSFHSISDYSTKDTTEELQAQSRSKLRKGCRSLSPKKSPLSKKLSQKSTLLAEEAIDGLIEVLEDYIESRSELEGKNSFVRSERKPSPEYTGHETECPCSQKFSDSPKLSPAHNVIQCVPNQSDPRFAEDSSMPSNLLCLNCINKQVTAICKRYENSEVKPQICCGRDVTKCQCSNDSRTYKESSTVTALSKQKQSEATMSRKCLTASEFTEDKVNKADMISNSTKTRLSQIYHQDTEDIAETTVSKQDPDEINKSRKSSNETRLTDQRFDEARSREQDGIEYRKSKQDIDEAIINQRDLESRMSKRDSEETRMSKKDMDETGMSKKESYEIRVSQKDMDEAGMSNRDLYEAKMSQKDMNDASLNKRDPDETRLTPKKSDEARSYRRSFNESLLSHGTFNSVKLSKSNSNEGRMRNHEHGNTGSNNQDFEQTRGSKIAFIRADSIIMSNNVPRFPEKCKQYLHGSRVGLGGEYNMKSNEGHNHAQKQKNKLCDLTYKQCIDKCKMDLMNCNQTSLRANGPDIWNSYYNEGKLICRNNADVTRSELRKQLTLECANIIKNPITSYSPYCDNRYAKVSKDTCKSTSPPRARREEDDPIYSSYEKSRNSTLKSESSKSGAANTEHYKKRLRKIKSYIVESKDYQQSSNTFSDDRRYESNNKDDLSGNQNSSEHRISKCHSSKQFWIASKSNKCSNRRASSLTSRKSESSKHYMQPRCNSSDSSGSGEPLLFSSQEIDLNFDDSCMDSYRMNQLQKSNKKQRPNNPCFAGDDSDLLEYTTTTSDSCACDNAMTSSHKSSSISSSSKQRPSSKTRSVDDTEGDIDQENYLEEELEQNQMLQNKRDSKKRISKSDSSPHDYPSGLKSHTSKLSSSDKQSELHDDQSNRSRHSIFVPSGRVSSGKEGLPEINRRGSNTTKYASSLRSSLYNPGNDVAGGQDGYRSQHGSQLAASEGLLPVNKYSNIFTDEQSYQNDLAENTSEYKSQPLVGQNLESDIGSRHSAMYYSQAMLEDGDVLRKQSELSKPHLPSILSSSNNLTRSAQGNLSAATIQSQLLTQSTSRFGQQPQEEELRLAESNIGEQSLLHNVYSADKNPSSLVRRDTSLSSQQSNMPRRSSEIFKQISIRAESLTIPSHTASVQREPSTLQQPSITASVQKEPSTLQQPSITTQSPEAFEHSSKQSTSSAIPSHTASVQREPLTLQQPSITTQLPETIIKTSKQSTIPDPIESVQHLEMKEETVSIPTMSEPDDNYITQKHSHRSRKSFESNKHDSVKDMSTKDLSEISDKSLSSGLQLKQSNVTHNSGVESQLLTAHSNTEGLNIERDKSPLKSPQPKSPKEASYASSKQSAGQTMSELSRQSPFQSEPIDNVETSKHSVLSSRYSPAKPVQSSGTQKSLSPEDFDAISDVHSGMSHALTKIKSRGSPPAKRKVSVKPSEDVVENDEGSESEQVETPYSVASSASSLNRKDPNEIYVEWHWWIPLLLFILLILLYYRICDLAGFGGCVGCRAPLPNIFFSIMNSAVHSVRLIHSTPAPV